MALIRPGQQTIDWTLFNRDKYLRNQDAPSLSDDPLTVRDVRGGIEVVGRSGNVMPRAITRDKLGQDALLTPMNLTLDPSVTVQVATGYDRSLNSYLYVVTWDGVNYALRRFNTMDLLSPYQDAFLVNTNFGLQGGEVITHVYGVAVTGDAVVVSYQLDSGNIYLAKFGFDLTFVSRMRSDVIELSLDKQFTADDLSVATLSNNSNANVTMVSQTKYTTACFMATGGGGNPGTGFPIKQTFKTGPNTSQISGFDIYCYFSNAGYDYWIKSADGSTTLKTGRVSTSAVDGWYGTTFSPITVQPDTTYQLVVAVYQNSLGLSWFGTPQSAYDEGTPTGGGGSDSTPPPASLAFKIFSPNPQSGAKVIRFDPATYKIIDSYAWTGTVPTGLYGYDSKFYYAFDAGNRNIVKFAIINGSIVQASTQTIQETVKGIMNFNSFIYVVYSFGTGMVAVPVSI